MRRGWHRNIITYSPHASAKPPLRKIAPQRRWSSDLSAPAITASAGRRKVIFSGIQPTGVPHLGNYLGALRPWVQLQDGASEKDDLFFSIVDLHAVTAQPDAGQLRKRRKEMMASLLAIGLNPNRCAIFYQSAVRNCKFMLPCRVKKLKKLKRFPSMRN